MGRTTAELPDSRKDKGVTSGSMRRRVRHAEAEKQGTGSSSDCMCEHKAGTIEYLVFIRAGKEM